MSDSFGCVISVLTDGKPTILVVLHHTFNPGLVVADSRRQVNDPNVHLTVDCLFYEGKLLKCDRNKIAWIEVMKVIGMSYQDDAKRVIILILYFQLLL